LDEEEQDDEKRRGRKPRRLREGIHILKMTKY
jgi:hypothetical protein